MSLFPIKVIPFLLLLFCLVSTDAGKATTINSDGELESYLCQGKQMSHFALNKTSFKLGRGSLCRLPPSQEITIAPSSGINSSTIYCEYTPNVQNQSRSGIAFVDSYVSISNVKFENCGMFLRTFDSDIIHHINESSFQYSINHSAVLVFVRCVVNMTHVQVINSFGFAVIGANIYNSTLSNVNISAPETNFTLWNTSVGSGVLLHYFNEEYACNNDSYSATINGSFFNNNLDYGDKASEPLIAAAYNPITMVNAAGLTVIDTLQCEGFGTNIAINNSVFKYNFKFGCPSGGLLIIQNSTLNSKVLIQNAVFVFNVNLQCHGGGLAYYWLNIESEHEEEPTSITPLTVLNATFTNHTGIQIGAPNPIGARAAVFIGIVHSMDKLNITIIMKGCRFENNTNPSRGNALYSVMYSKKSQASILLIDTVAEHNSQYAKHYRSNSYSGTLYFHGIDVLVSGQSNFNNNYGSVLVGLDSSITISGEANFTNNTGIIGPAIQLQGNGYLTFENSKINFTNNHAQSEGGAIYIQSTVPTRFKCVISIDNSSGSSYINFTNNSAKSSGSSIYINTLEPCYARFAQHYLNQAKDVLEYYSNSFKITERNNNSRVEISTQPKQLCVCFHNSTSQCKTFIHEPTYPGRTVKYDILAKDSTNRSNIYTSIHVDIDSRNSSHSLHFLKETRHYITENRHPCTLVKFKVTSTREFSEPLYGDVSFSLPESNVVATSYIKVKPCPMGFEFDSKTRKCGCSSVLMSFADVKECSIENSVIKHPIDKLITIWAGRTHYSNGKLAVSLECPQGYCHNELKNLCGEDDTISVTNETLNSNKSCTESSDSFCLYKRTGALCGQCIEGHSVVFGSTECKPCSNLWLLTIFIYILAGPLFIYMLYALKLTLTTGTINGIIFYSQMTNVGIADLLKIFASNSNDASIISSVALFCLSLTNVSIGLPLCLYNGLTETVKAGINLLFPLYLLSIVVFLIILSRYSLKVSNRIADSSVQVLATVIHFSFSRLLLGVIDVFTRARVFTETSNHTVWFFDGNVEYGKKYHLLLMIITVFIVSALLLPYTLMLLFARPLRRTILNPYTRPFLEAIHAPYKTGQEYFFAFQLILVFVVYVVYATYRSSDLLYLYVINAPLLAVYLMLHTYCKPFKSKAANILYCWLMLNVLLVGMTTWYFLVHIHKDLLKLKVIVSSAIFLEFITFVLIIFYHFLWVTGKIPFITGKIELIYTKIQARKEEHVSSINRNDRNGSFYQSVNYREPMISSVAY